MKEHEKEIIDPAVTEVDFFIPEDCCPERADEESFPSPSTRLTEEIALKIEAANRLLLSLSLDLVREDEDDEGDGGAGENVRIQGLREAFDGLVGQEVRINIECAEEDEAEEAEEEDVEIDIEETDDVEVEEQAMDVEHEQVSGRVLLSGRNFVLLHCEHDKILVPYQNIIKVKLMNRFAEAFHERTIDDVDPVERRCITFRFGQVVSGSPELINTFFGLTLQNFLLKAIDGEIIAVFNNRVLKGILECVDQTSITICEKDKEISFETLEACYYILPDFNY